MQAPVLGGMVQSLLGGSGSVPTAGLFVVATDNARRRAESARRAADEFRSGGVIAAAVGLVSRFGRNNRALLGR